MNRIRHFIEDARERMLALPVAFSVVAGFAAVTLVWLDQQISTETLPRMFQTSVDGGREVLGTIAMGLITAYTLLLTLLLIAVQLASSQFSPRTLRDWLSDRTLQRAIGIVLATVVFCLLVLYQTRDLDDVDIFEPNLSVLTAIILGVTSLIVVLRSVDHLADSLRVGSVAKRVMNETLELIDRIGDDQPLDRPTISPAPRLLPSVPERPPDNVHVVMSESAGWVQEIELDMIADACAPGSTVHVPVAVGAFVWTEMPLVWVTPISDGADGAGDLDELDRMVRRAVAIGDVRTMRQDIGYGLTRLVDIALRALSPSLNDPNTANDVIAHLGEIVLALLARPESTRVSMRNGRTVVAVAHSHPKYLLAAFDQIRHASLETPRVVATLVQTLLTIGDEVERRSLPARVADVHELIDEIVDDVERSDLSPRERQRIFELLPRTLRPAHS